MAKKNSNTKPAEPNEEVFPEELALDDDQAEGDPADGPLPATSVLDDERRATAAELAYNRAKAAVIGGSFEPWSEVSEFARGQFLASVDHVAAGNAPRTAYEVMVQEVLNGR